MADDDENKSYSDLLEFVTSYNGLMEVHLRSVQDMMTGTVNSIMESIHKLSDTTAEGHKVASDTLEEAYLDPDQETLNLVNDMQSFFDTLHGFGEIKDSEKLTNEIAERKKWFEEKFGPSLAKLEEVDNNLSEIIFKIIGTLSNEDVITQRLEHVGAAVTGLTAMLDYIILDQKNRLDEHHLQLLKTDVLKFLKSSYTMEEEKIEFRQIFKEAS